jgi:glycosyltransferase involved in cell wall biosynthesis
MHLSIIIPFYNTGHYIYDAIDSVQQYKGKYSCEIIIVNDGSTDKVSLDILENLKKESGHKVVDQSNMGPAGARNTGCRISKGEYLLFLDSDNKIKPEYIDKAIAIFEKQKHIGVVYANPIVFGETIRAPFISGEFNIVKLLGSNYIDMCSFVRKSVWESVNGFDEDRRVISYEDWELWLSIYKKDWGFSFLNEQLFYYRVRADSLLETAKMSDSRNHRISYLYAKHSDLLAEHYPKLLTNYIIYEKDKNTPFRSFLKYLLLKFKKK